MGNANTLPKILRHRKTLGVVLWCATILAASLLAAYLIINHPDAVKTTLTTITHAALK